MKVYSVMFDYYNETELELATVDVKQAIAKLKETPANSHGVNVLSVWEGGKQLIEVFISEKEGLLPAHPHDLFQEESKKEYEELLKLL